MSAAVVVVVVLLLLFYCYIGTRNLRPIAKQ